MIGPQPILLFISRLHTGVVMISGSDPLLEYAIILTVLISVAVAYTFYRLRQKELRINKVLHQRNSELADQKKELHGMLDVVQALNSQLQAQNKTMKHVAIVSFTDLDGRIINVNENFVVTSGYEKDEVLGKRHDFLKSGLHDKDFYAQLWQTIATGSTWRGEICNRKKSGDHYWTDTAIAPILDEHDRPKQYFALQFEITKRKRYEAQLKEQSEQMAEMNKVKDKLFSTVSHDFRSPLNSLRGTLSLFLGGNISQQEMNQIGSSLLEKLEVTSNMLDNLLHWAKNQMKGITVNPGKINMHELAIENIDLIKVPAEKKGLRIINEVQDPAWVYADSEMVKLVLRNLLSNAMKFSKKDGKIVIATEVAEGASVVTYIKDQGVGIDAERLEKLFTLEVSTSEGTSNEVGIGLGLTLCKEFVERNNGALWVESKKGQGSTFYFSLPGA